MNKELRSSGHIEVRSTSTGRIATGYAIVFSPSRSQDLGGFVEQVDPGAMKLGQKNIWALRGHDSNKQLGSTDSGTLRLSKDTKGIRYELDIPATSDGNDLVTLLQRGDGGRCSFGFTVISDDWKVLSDNTVLRTLLDIDVFEISIGVVFPAYSATTSALRSVPQHIREQIKSAVAATQHSATCECRCERCLDDDCDECTNTECDSEQCDKCPMQADAQRTDSIRIRRLFTALRNK
jgi:HK97 family phage prohead protease